MPYEHATAAFWQTPWAILPEKLAEMRAFLLLKLQGRDVDPAEVARVVAGRRSVGELAQDQFDDAQEDFPVADSSAGPALRGGATMSGRVGCIPVMGVISQRVGMLGKASGGVSCEDIGAALDAMTADRQCKAIVMQFDSPGGSVYGVEELGRKILAARGEKKVIGVADSVAASAAYWLISQCSEVCVTPSGQVGSIGVIAAHEDHSQEETAAGVKTTLVASSTYKAEGSPFAPLDDAARAEMQSKVDHYHSLFTAAVARGRGVTPARVSADYGQGRMVTSADAVSRGMADRVATMAQVLSRLGGDPGQAGPNAFGPSPLAAALPTAVALAQYRARSVEVE